MRMMTVGGVGLACEVSGSGQPLLLIHGFTGSSVSWSRQVPALREHHRTISVDLLGHGRSDAPADPARYGIERQAADLAALLSALGVARADVLGYSMGARLALRLTIDHPTRVERLVLEGPSAGIADAGERSRRREADGRLADGLESDGVAAFVDVWEAQPLFASHAGLPDDVRAEIRRERLSQRAIGLANALRGAGQGAMVPMQGRLAEIHAPCLVIAGELDRVGLARATEVAEGIERARLEIVAGAGHTPHLERPQEFGCLIDSFLTTQAAHTH